MRKLKIPLKGTVSKKENDKNEAKYIIGRLVIVAFIIFGAISFMQNNIEYVTAKAARKFHRTVQVKGTWVKRHAKFL